MTKLIHGRVSITAGALMTISFVVAPLAAAQSSSGLGLKLYAGLSITGQVASLYTIQQTSDVADSNSWRALDIIQLTNQMQLYIDTATPVQAQRYYRSMRWPLGMAWIPPGTFLMGSPSTESGRNSNEGPQTYVTFTRGFFIGKFEVTQGEYLSLMGTNPSAYKGNLNLPVETVTWNDAAAYCARLTQIEQAAGRLPTRWVYRLPSEAQWEYACRAGTATRFSHGDDGSYTLLPLYAWFGDPTTGKPNPVGTKLPNPWGLYDMHGNVWELCQDLMTYTGGSVIDPPLSGVTARMTRGGSWHSLGPRLRSASRNPYDTVNREAWVGFRIILAAQ